MIRYLLPVVLLLSACGPIPIQLSSQKQTQSSKQDVAQEVANELAASNASAHESKQGTNSMPVIIICNTTSSPNASCAAQPKDGPIVDAIRAQVRKER
jgi:hypothetical protein